MVLKYITQNRHRIFFFALLSSLFQYSIVKLYGFSVFPDEFSYWAYAAAVAGYNWSDVISLGSFYSYGYSLFLFPVFVFCSSPVRAYRVAVGLNFVFIALAYLILYKVCTTFLDDKSDNCQLYVTIAMLYPAILFYAQTTMAETLLMLGYLLLVFLFNRYLQNPGCENIVLLVLLNFYLYLVHMRTITTFVICIGLIIFYILKNKTGADRRREVFLSFFLTALAFAAAYFLKRIVTESLYSSLYTELYEINTYEGQIKKLIYIFTKEGFLVFVKGLCGKILYLGISAYGMAFWGVAYLLRKIFRKEKDQSFYISVFVFLTVCAQIVINTVYNVLPDSYDCITYGRYQDYIMPILIVLGIKEILLQMAYWKRYVIVTAAILVSMLFIVLQYAAQMETMASKEYFMVGLVFWGQEGALADLFYKRACCFGILYMCLYIAVFWKYSQNGHKYLLYFCVIAQLAVVMQHGNRYIYPFNRLAYQDIQLSEKIERLLENENHNSYVTFIDYNEISAIGLMRFALPDSDIKIISKDEDILKTVDTESVVLLGANMTIQEELERMYGEEIISGHFILLYNKEAY